MRGGRRIGSVVVVGVLAAAIGVEHAAASWSAPASVAPGQDGVVVAGTAGRSAVVQASGDGQITVVSHAFGGAWSAPRVVLESATSEDGALGSDGTVAARTASGRATVGRVGADGAFTGIVEGAVPAGTDTIAAGSSSDGSALVALTDGDDVLTVYRAAAGTLTGVGGQAPEVLGTGVGDAAIVSTGPGRYVVVWSEGAESGAARVRTATVSGTSVTRGSAQVLTDGLDGNASVDAVAVAAVGPDAVAGWIVNDASTGARNAQVRSATRVSSEIPPVTLNSAVAAEYLDLATVGDGAVAVWGGTFRNATSGSATTFDGTGRRGCDVPHDLSRAFVVAGPSGPEIAGPGPAADGAALTRLSVAGCAPGARTTGPAVGRAPVVAGAIDGEGSVVAVLGSAEGPSPIYVDDVAGPTVAGIVVPAVVDAGATFPVRADVADAWNPTTVSWTVGGAPAGAPGAQTVLGPLSAGDHVVGGVARDAVQNPTGLPARTLVARDTSAPAPPPPVVVAPPVDVPVPPPTPGATAPPGTAPPAAPLRPGAAPRVDSARLIRTARGWRVRVRVRGAIRLRIRLFREAARPGRALGRPSRCGKSLTTHAPGGRQGERLVRAPASTVDVAVSSAMARALRSRGRYSLVVRAYGPTGRASPELVARRTVC